MVVSIVLLGVGGLAYWSNSQGESIGAGNLPHVTIVGNINKLPQSIKNDLPTGYSSLSTEASIPVDYLATKDNDPVSVFLFKPGNPHYNIKEQIQYATDKGRQEVYIIIDEKKVGGEWVQFSKDNVLETLQGIDFYTLDDVFFDFLSTPSYANSVQGSNCGGSTLPTGSCSSASFIDDDFSDGKTPSFKLCVDYAAFACYFDSVFDHLKKNLAETSTVTCNHTSSNSSQCQWVDCIKAHNTPGFIKAPVNLRVELFFDGGDLVDDEESCGSNAGNVCGCAYIESVLVEGEPRESTDSRMYMNGQHSCSWMELMRHELAHTYGYKHQAGQQDYSSNRDNMKHCKNKHYIH